MPFRIIIAAAILGGAAFLGRSAYSQDSRPASPAEALIARAEKQLAKTPTVKALNDLALGYVRRARERADAGDYDRALEALDRAKKLDSGAFETERLRVWTLLGKHEFAIAFERAKALQKRAPDDILVYGFLCDAAVELGDYKSAEEAAQWMLDLRPGNVPGLTRGAYLRELFGDIDGAVDFMTQAYHATPNQEVEDRAWILTHIAHLETSRARYAAARRLLAAALKLFPDYHYALMESAEVALGEGKLDEALAFARQRAKLAPHPENLFDVAQAIDRLAAVTADTVVKEALVAEAGALYATFEKAALAESNGADNANRQLVRYFVDVKKNADLALRLAQKEALRRKDVFTMDALAWALSAAGRHDEALTTIEKALLIGLQDAAILVRAGTIARRAGEIATAVQHWKKAAAIAPGSPAAAEAEGFLAQAVAKSGSRAAR